MRQSWTDDRLDDLHRLLTHAVIVMTGGILAGNAALGALIVTQL